VTREPTGESVERQICLCGKRQYLSKKQARLACKFLSNRFRIYECQDSQTWHITKAAWRKSKKDKKSKKYWERRGKDKKLELEQ
jgi:hypothetical protein